MSLDANSIVLDTGGPLDPGDIMFVGWDSDNEDVAFVTTTDLAPGEVIYFTDDEWDGSRFDGGEQLIEWVVPEGGVEAGAVVTIDMTTRPGNAQFDIGGDVDYIRGGGALAQGNEMMWAFQGTRDGDAVTPENFVAVIGNEADGRYTHSPELSETGLSASNGAIIIDGDEDFMQVNVSDVLGDSVSREDLIEAISDLANWTTFDGRGNNNPNGTGFDVDIPDILPPVEPSGPALFENTPGAVVGRISVVDPDAGDSHSFEVSDPRFEVMGGALRLKPGVSLDHEAAATIALEVTATDSGGLSIAESFEITVLELPDMTIETGFTASYFDVDHRIRAMSDVDWEADPTHEELVSTIDYENGRDSFWDGGAQDTFGVRIEGQIEVEEAGVYEFYLGADDGAILFINGQPVINNDGPNGKKDKKDKKDDKGKNDEKGKKGEKDDKDEKERHSDEQGGFATQTGEIELEPGHHSIEVRYFENHGRAGLKLEWEGPGTEGRELVSASSELAVEPNGTTGFGIQIPDATSPAEVMIEGLPAETILTSGEDALVSDGGPADVTGWNLDLIEFSPPIGFVGQIQGAVATKAELFNGQVVDQKLEFEISVDDPLTAQTDKQAAQGSIFVLDSVENDPAINSWTSDTDTQSFNEGDDVLSEEISQHQTSEGVQENFDTYERYDW